MIELVQAASVARFKATEGWPQALQPAQAAALHTWREGAQPGHWRTVERALHLAIKAGALQPEARTHTVQERQPVPTMQVPRGWDSVPQRQIFRTVVREVTHHYITAADFAAWLRQQGQEPGPLAAAWFKSQGIGAAEPVQAAPAAKGTGETTEERNLRWYGIWVQFGGPAQRGAQTQAKEYIANTEGVLVDTAKAGMQAGRKVHRTLEREGRAPRLPKLANVTPIASMAANLRRSKRG